MAYTTMAQMSTTKVKASRKQQKKFLRKSAKVMYSGTHLKTTDLIDESNLGLSKEMTLEFNKFKDLCEAFVSISSQLGDEWCLKTLNKAGIKDVYLEKRVTRLDFKEQSSILNGINEEIGTSPSFTIFVYHILYSPSYSVPVLCFNAHRENGKLLSLEEIWKQIPDCHQSVEPNYRWNMLTQQEHPKLGIPCFMLHPCHTKDLVQCDNSSNYLISWLSIVGPVAGLNLSLEYAKFT